MKQLFLFVGILLCAQKIDAELAPPATITIQNIIKIDDLKKMGQFPQFAILVDGKKIDPGNSINIPTTDKLIVRYEYSFLKGMYKGAHDVTFSLNNAQQRNYELNFSWKKEHEPWRVHMTGATAMGKKKIS